MLWKRTYICCGSAPIYICCGSAPIYICCGSAPIYICCGSAPAAGSLGAVGGARGAGGAVQAVQPSHTRLTAPAQKRMQPYAPEAASLCKRAAPHPRDRGLTDPAQKKLQLASGPSPASPRCGMHPLPRGKATQTRQQIFYNAALPLRALPQLLRPTSSRLPWWQISRWSLQTRRLPQRLNPKRIPHRSEPGRPLLTTSASTNTTGMNASAAEKKYHKNASTASHEGGKPWRNTGSSMSLTPPRKPPQNCYPWRCRRSAGTPWPRT